MQTCRHRRPSDAAPDHSHLSGAGSRRSHTVNALATNHLALAAIARDTLNRETCGFKPAPHLASRGEACQRTASTREPANLGQHIRLPHARIASRRKPVEKPGIRLKIE